MLGLGPLAIVLIPIVASAIMSGVSMALNKRQADQMKADAKKQALRQERIAQGRNQKELNLIAQEAARGMLSNKMELTDIERDRAFERKQKEFRAQYENYGEVAKS